MLTRKSFHSIFVAAAAQKFSKLEQNRVKFSILEICGRETGAQKFLKVNQILQVW